MILKKEIIKQLSKELLLPFTGIEQDWDIEMANSKRIDEFIKFYKESHLCDDKKVAVMSLILSSYDDLLNENNLEIDDRWNEIKSILESERIIFIDLIDYWSLSNEVEENLFRITPLMRNIK
ncbi:hypothetical protein [Parapedobacter koreensis]|uniref:Uncharacterized protein n=1 Tax=Parapedobacter koreensis TaxID=332977 RepID=A0A1H7HWN5_9SPHI|nr:hypothetical protein [Parapedobacter koreensis]SEK54568.1 hypothetical protein SAMN05421740_10239 [Parapedobacter koreensis]